VNLRTALKSRLVAPTLTPELCKSGEYAYGCHTREGKKRGKTKADFFKAEQAGLQPFQLGLFDHLSD